MKYINSIALVAVTVFASIVYAQETETEPTKEVIYTDSVTNSNVNSNTKSDTTLRTPPPSAITPTINSSNSDLCTIGVAGAVQTQILGISAGTMFTEENCLRLKNAKTLYDMGMKVAAVSVMCQDEGVFKAMMHAGTPCPYDGMIGDAAKVGWQSHEDAMKPPNEEGKKVDEETLGLGAVGGLLLLLLLL
jgi:hypothetical protein